MSARFPTKSSLIRYFIKGSACWFVLSAVLTAFVSLFKMLIPKAVSFMVDSLIGNTAAAVFVAAAALLRFFFRFLFNTCCVRGAESFVKRMRDEVFEHILLLPFSWIGDNKTGDLIQRCTSDIETVKHFVSEELKGILQTGVLIIMAAVFLAGIDIRIMAVSVLFIPVIVVFSAIFYSRIGKGFKEAAEKESALSTATQENLAGVRVVRAFGMERVEKEKFQKRSGDYAGQWLKVRKHLFSFYAIENLLTGIQTLTVSVISVVLAVNGSISAGDFIAVISYIAMLVGPERSIGRVFSEMKRAEISIDRLRFIMNEPAETDEGSASPPMDRDIVFEHVSFSYGKDSDEVLKDVSFAIPAGSTLGILGGTGSGKTTLMYLLSRLYKLPSDCGRIMIGGVDISDIRLSYLRDNIGMVLQEPFLFSGTLAENIGISDGSGDIKKIREAAMTAGIDDTIREFDDGYDTIVGERGVMLSGGQKQRTAIAQMIIRKTPIQVFDDPLSSVDPKTDLKIRSRLRECSGNATVILISHRVATLMDSDHIIVLDQGRICEEGTHEELLLANGIYRKVYDYQSGAGI